VGQRQVCRLLVEPGLCPGEERLGRRPARPARSPGKGDVATSDGRPDVDHAQGLARCAEVGDGARHDRDTEPARHEVAEETDVARLQCDARIEAGGVARLLEVRAQGGSPGEGHERLLTEISHGDGSAVGQLMLRRGHEDERLDGDELESQPVRRVRFRQTDDDGVVVVAPKVLDQGQWVLLSQRHLDSGVPVVKRREQPGHVDVGNPGDRPQAEPSAHDAPQPRQRCSPGVGGLERVARVGEERAAGGGEADGLGGPVDELFAELRLEPADLLAYARLGHVKALCGAREALVPRHGDEVGELA
jgi:hypothetical protein